MALRSKSLSIRVSEEEKEMIDNLAKRLHLNQTTMICMLVALASKKLKNGEMLPDLPEETEEEKRNFREIHPD